jgi:hypothetical protein
MDLDYTRALTPARRLAPRRQPYMLYYQRNGFPHVSSILILNGSLGRFARVAGNKYAAATNRHTSNVQDMVAYHDMSACPGCQGKGTEGNIYSLKYMERTVQKGVRKQGPQRRAASGNHKT